VKIHGAFLILVVSWATIFSIQSFAQSKYWIFFKDKPNAEIFPSFSKHLSGQEATATSGQQIKSVEDYLVENGVLTRRAIDRRLKVLPPSSVVSVCDFPVYPPYLDSLRSIGLTVTGTSRWFNAAVVVAGSTALVQAEKFQFVLAIKKVAVYVNPIKPFYSTKPITGRLTKLSDQIQPGDSSFYGPSYAQYELSGIPQVHSLGIDGAGVLIGMLDDGFRYESHEALKNIRVVGEHDFIQNDSITANQAGDSPDQDAHGTLTLSAVGGYSPGNIVGPAYGASFLLAKTELIYPDPSDVDYKSEEDNWVNGIEWMESRGVDVVSSSLAYNIFVDSLTGAIDSAESYFWSRGDFNGRTSLASLAATKAAELGVVVVQAMGNEGNGDGSIGTMDAPADADSIISVGATNWDGALTNFSSTGPTNDARIKPDLVADGSSDYAASVPGPDTYEYVSGTSLSTPITAGVAALILSVRPDFTPMQVINLLKSSAIRVMDSRFPSRTSTYPNNYYGWGIVNAWNAIKTLGFVGTNYLTSWQENSSLYFAIRAFSVHGIDPSRCMVYYSTNGRDYSSVPIIQTDTSGQVVFKVSPTNFSAIDFYFSLVDSAGNNLNVPYYGSLAPFKITAPWESYLQLSNENFVLFNNYPNPFNTQTRIGIALKNSASVNIDVFDILGRKVNTLFSGEMSPGYQAFVWDGRNRNGRETASGTYFIKVSVAGAIKILKTLYLK
jgi:serine protease AprX